MKTVKLAVGGALIPLIILGTAPIAGAETTTNLWNQGRARALVRSLPNPSSPRGPNPHTTPVNLVVAQSFVAGVPAPQISTGVPSQGVYIPGGQYMLGFDWNAPNGSFVFQANGPLAAGQIDVDAGVLTVPGCPLPAHNTVRIDQLVVGPVYLPTGVATVEIAALQWECVSDDGTHASFGTLAYNATPTTPGQGYYLYGAAGTLAGFGNDAFLDYLGDLALTPLNKPIVGMAITPSGGGYWMVGGDGGVFAYGDAGFYGSTGNLVLNKPVVGMARSPDGHGYWFVASDGGIFSYGDAGFYGSTGSLVLNRPIVGMAATPDGRGYWLVAADGGIFAFGDAGFYGSTGNLALNQPIVGMAPTPDGRGYWLVAADGGVFAFGDAGFYGSTGNLRLNSPIVGMTPTPDGRGYWFAGGDGGVFAYGDAAYDGSLGGTGITDAVGMAR